MTKRRPLKRSKPRARWGTGWGYHMRKWTPRNIPGLVFWFADGKTLVGPDTIAKNNP